MFYDSLFAQCKIYFFFIIDRILKCSSKFINNKEIGGYFSTFNGTYYVPNKRLEKVYPEDIAVLLKKFPNHF